VAASDAQGGDAAQGTALRKMLRLLKNNRQTGLLLPSERDDNGELLYELSLLSNEGRKNHDSNAIIQRYLMLQAMALLADFLVLGHEENGARSVADNKTNFFALGLGALLDSVCAVFNRHAIPRLLHLNGLPLEEMPKLKHSDIQTSGMETFTKAIQQAVGAGLLTITEDDETYVREELGLPAITEERRQQVKDDAQAEFEREHEAQMELKDADRQENVEDA